MNFLPTEDRTCRMCGYVDVQNINIYSQNDLYKKILELYPIILYQSDPLPKNICVKCYNMVLYRYEEYHRITKIQNKWISNVRNNQANNPYIAIIDKIDEVNNNLCQSLTHLSPNFESESFHLVRFNKNFPLDIEFTENNDAPSPLSELFSLPKTIGPRSFVSRNRNDNFCQYCSLRFHNQIILAKHQLTHLNVKLFKCFDLKRLNKNLMHARIILVNDVKFLRCTNCGKIFSSGSKILQHWRDGKCEYYCKLCGEEFPTSQKELHKHVRLIHNLNFKFYSDINENMLESYNIKNQFTDDIQIIYSDSDSDYSDSGINYAKMPILELKLNTDDFDIIASTDAEENSNLDPMKNKAAPLLRVKNLSELQGPSNGSNDEDNNFSNFTDLKLNTVSFL